MPHFKDTLEAGLAQNGQVVVRRVPPHAPIAAHPPAQPMIPTYVFGWPSGKETGNYLAIDLGACLRLVPALAWLPCRRP